MNRTTKELLEYLSHSLVGVISEGNVSSDDLQTDRSSSPVETQKLYRGEGLP